MPKPQTAGNFFSKLQFQYSVTLVNKQLHKS